MNADGKVDHTNQAPELVDNPNRGSEIHQEELITTTKGTVQQNSQGRSTTRYGVNVEHNVTYGKSRPALNLSLDIRKIAVIFY